MASDLSARERFARRMAAGDPTLRLYAILDAESCRRRGLAIDEIAHVWRDAGVRLLQFRDKQGTDDDVLRAAETIAKAFRTADSILLLNDRVHLLARCGWDGAHVGQRDRTIAQARALAGQGAILGLSTHKPEQADAAGREDLDYIAIGPIFATATKVDADPVVGLCGLEAVRALVRKPLVAIGGIGLQQAREVRRAGADSIASISGLIPELTAQSTQGRTLGELAEQFLMSLNSSLPA